MLQAEHWPLAIVATATPALRLRRTLIKRHISRWQGIHQTRALPLQLHRLSLELCFFGQVLAVACRFVAASSFASAAACALRCVVNSSI